MFSLLACIGRADSLELRVIEIDCVVHELAIEEDDAEEELQPAVRAEPQPHADTAAQTRTDVDAAADDRDANPEATPSHVGGCGCLNRWVGGSLGGLCV